MSKRIKVYLAGKVEKNCWRHSIVEGLHRDAAKCAEEVFRVFSTGKR